ncbi:uncharacterized protein LOC109609310 [Aethina tumida]|uniref:uncharacterized protein LOC109609310 n=1 Tax=Aethina tumida TaxID=116153 RepID=UPI00096B32A4|nr:uncharacterized protein LOC109609310 [Aethina tumida]
MKTVIVLCTLLVQVFSDCNFIKSNNNYPRPNIVICNGASPSTNEAISKVAKGKPLNYIAKFTLESYNGNLNSEVLSLFTGLQICIIKNNQISTLPNGLFDYSSEKLESLRIINNQLTTIQPNVFKTLAKLKKLEVVNNIGLREFDIEWLKNNKNLEVLGVPTATFKTLTVAKLSSMFPKLRTLIVSEADKTSVRDKIEEIRQKYTVSTQ